MLSSTLTTICIITIVLTHSHSGHHHHHHDSSSNHNMKSHENHHHSHSHDHHDHESNAHSRDPSSRKPRHECSNHHHTIKRGDGIRRFHLPYNNHPYDKSSQNVIITEETDDDITTTTSKSPSILDKTSITNPEQDMEEPSTSTYPQHKSVKNSKKRKRQLLTDAEAEPIRIKAYYDTTTISTSAGLTTAQINYIKQVMSAVINYYQEFVQVIPVSGNWGFDRCNSWWTIASEYESCAGYQTSNVYCQDAPVPSDHYGDVLYHAWGSETTVIQGGNGISDADLVVYVTYGDTSTCSGNVLAYAGPCASDQYGRPVAGNINICSNFLSNTAWKEDVQTILHEMSHITIMLSGLWDEFRDSDGNLIPEADVYGYSNDVNEWIVKSDKVAELVSDHFGCASSNAASAGLPLADNGFGDVGSHWHSRYANMETMNPTSYGGTIYYSKFTLALMEDSGWYYVDYEYAEPFYFGSGEGCGFLTNTCINTNNGNARFGDFCSASTDDGCNPDYSAPANCLYYTSWTNIPTEYQYFSDSSIGGPYDTNFCPIRDPSGNDYESICVDTRGDTEDTAYYGEVWGSTSRCSVIRISGATSGYCFTHNCLNYANGQYASVDITVNGGTVNCAQGEEGTFKTTTISGATLECPVVDIVCGTDNGFGQCYFGHYSDAEGKCVCSPGYTGTGCDAKDECNTNNDNNCNIATTATSRAPTSSPTTGPSSVCVSGLGSYAIGWDDEWLLDSYYNWLGAYKHPTKNRYLFWNYLQHYWQISASVASNAGTYCTCGTGGVSDFTEDIAECDGEWICGGTAYPNAKISYGDCSSSGTTTTTSAPQTTAIEECDRAIKRTQYTVNYNNMPSDYDDDLDGDTYLNDAIENEFFPNNPDCPGDINTLNYMYLRQYKKPKSRLTIKIEACCGDAPGAVFPDGYTKCNNRGVCYTMQSGAAFSNDYQVNINDGIDAREIAVFVIIGCLLIICIVAVIYIFMRYRGKQGEKNAVEMQQKISNDKMSPTPVPDNENDYDGNNTTNIVVK